MDVEFRCPDCRVPLALRPGEGCACPSCARAFAPKGGVYDLLPRRLEAPKQNEDLLHEEEKTADVWRRLVYQKRASIEEFERDVLPSLLPSDDGIFLELGGGLCYASALVKLHRPRTRVLATDVSALYLRSQSRAAAQIMHSPVDVFAAVDGENLPFADAQFSSVFCNVVIYRVPDPARMLREIRRVLAPGGIFCAMERSFPEIPYFRRRHSALLDGRSHRYGVAERGRPLSEWRRLLAEAGFPSGTARFMEGRFLRLQAFRRLKSFFAPVPIRLRYVKAA